MLPGVTSTRLGADRCPGLLTPFVAQDGAIIRLRIPGGRVHVSTLAELLAIGTDFGAPMLALTSRTNLQVRGLPDPLPEEVMVRAEATGLLPSSTHERARNILAAPRAPEVRPLVAELDVALCADPLLAELPGRFLFAVSDATGSVLTEPFDVAYQALTPTTGVHRVGGLGMPCARADAVAHLLERARLFLQHRAGPRVWNIRDLPADSRVLRGLEPMPVDAAAPLVPGPIGDDLVAGIPLAMLRADHLTALARVTDEVVITPWRSVVIPGGTRFAQELGDAGFGVTATDPWARLSACSGAPWCARTSSPTMELALAAAPSLSPSGPRIHLVGCERACGAPTLDHVLVVDPRSVDDVVTADGVSDR
jgi:precorrin-3B synthase